MYSSQKVAQALVDIKWQHMLLFRFLWVMFGAYVHGKLRGDDHSWFGLKAFKDYTREVKISVLLRSFFGFGSFVSTMIAIYLLPVSVAVSIMMTTTFFTPILAWLIHDESISIPELITIVCGFFGVLMITNPDWFNHRSAALAMVMKTENFTNPTYLLGVVFAFSFALFAAMNIVTIRQMSGNMSTSLKTYYFGVFSTIASIIIVMVTEPGFFAFWNIGTSKYMSLGSFIGC